MSEAEEMHELQENAEKGRGRLVPVSVTMAVLAVVTSIVSLLGHRTHTEEILLQNKMTDQWAYYQAKNIRRQNYEVQLDMLAVQKSANPELTALRERYTKDVERYAEEQKEIESEAKKLTSEVETQRRRADRFDLAESVLATALVITSITLITSRRRYWYAGIVISVLGVALIISGFVVH